MTDWSSEHGRELEHRIRDQIASGYPPRTIGDFADACEVNRKTLNRWFRAERSPILGRGKSEDFSENLDLLAQLLGDRDWDDLYSKIDLAARGERPDLTELRNAHNALQIACAIAHIPYTYEVTREVRAVVRATQLPLFCNILAELLEGDGKPQATAMRPAGILATILSTRFHDWQANPSGISELDKLRQCCDRILADGDTSAIAVVEPLVFALAAYDRDQYTNMHERFLRACIENTDWLTATTKRYEQYYQYRDAQLEAIARHIEQRSHERGLLVAHDLPHLLAADLLSSYELSPLQRTRSAKLLTNIRDHLNSQSAYRFIDLIARAGKG